MTPHLHKPGCHCAVNIRRIALGNGRERGTVDWTQFLQSATRCSVSELTVDEPVRRNSGATRGSATYSPVLWLLFQ
jgi:hypothetical protein